MSTRRAFFVAAALVAASPAALAQLNTVQEIAPGVYFHEGDPRLGTCNNGWIEMGAYVVVVDANYPVGATRVLPKVRAATAKPVRYVVDTHFHPDHSFGNAIWSEAGATIVAQSGAFDELVAHGDALWAASAKDRPDVAASRLKLPDLVYTDRLVFEDGPRKVELRWPGAAHTRGDTLVWLPKERILFTGDVCVNGSYNYVHDSTLQGWIAALEGAKKLGAIRVCPGHGPIGGPEIIADQEEYFVELCRGVRALMDQDPSLAAVQAAAPALAARLRKNPQIARFVPSDHYFAAHAEKAGEELGGRPPP
jgi:cyclase